MTTVTRVFGVCALALLGACGTSAEDADDAAVELARCESGVSMGESCTDEGGAKLCPVDSGFPGDNLALCPPADEDDGFLFHYGPSNYDDPDEMAKYILEAGGEEEMCVFLRTPNTETVYVGDFHGRMRPGSHHLIVTLADDTGDIVFDTPIPCTQSGAISDRWLVGSQDPQVDVAPGGASNMSPPQPGDP